MTDRKPDYVFNVNSDGKVVRAIWTADYSAVSWLVSNNRGGPRVTHRIRVFMKDKRS